jgi:hypothetical protein
MALSLEAEGLLPVDAPTLQSAPFANALRPVDLARLALFYAKLGGNSVRGIVSALSR